LVVACTSCPFTATQSVLVGQAPEVNDGLLLLILHAAAPPAGSVEVQTAPALSLVKHWGCVEQKIAFSAPLRSIVSIDQALAPPVGLVEVATLANPTATHSVTDGQLTSLEAGSTPGRITVVVQTDGSAAGFIEV
jgi:hypothetical protein